MTSPTADDSARPGWRRDVLVLLSGQTVSMLGSTLVQYAIVWHLTITLQSGVVTTVSTIAGFLPQAIVSVFGGVWADRINRKRLIITADAAIAASTLALALVMVAGIDSLVLIFVALAIRSACAGIHAPAVSALIPQVVPTEHLMRVNGINGGIQTGMMLLAPALAGVLYATSSIVAIFFIDVGTALIGIAFLASLRIATIRTGAHSTYVADLVEGVRYIATHRFIRWLLGYVAVMFVLTGGLTFLAPLMLVRSFGDELWMLAALELSLTLGILLANLLVSTWAVKRNRVGVMIGATIAFAAIWIAMGLSTELWVFLGMMLLVGLGIPFFGTPIMTLLQERVEPERLGRVFGFWSLITALGTPVSVALIGPFADVVPIALLFVVAGLAMAVAVGVALLLPSGRRALREGRAPSVTRGVAAPVDA